MAMAQDQQDVVFSRDSQNNIIVDRYAKALDIAESDNPLTWEYERVILPMDRAIVHYAKLLCSPRVIFQGSQTMGVLTPKANYNVYVDLKLEEDAVGFDENVMFTFIGGQSEQITSARLQKGDNMILVGKFVPPSTGTFPIVNVKVHAHSTIQPKKGLVVRRMSFTTA